LNADADRGLLRVGYAALLAGITGSILLWDGYLMLVSTGIWALSMALLLAARRYDPRGFYWSWPAVIAGYFLLGGPPSPLGYLYRTVLALAPWGWRIIFALGLLFLVVSLLQRLRGRAQGRVRLPWPRQTISLVVGFTLLLVALLTLTRGAFQFIMTPVASGLWVLTVALGAAWVRWGTVVQQRIWYRIEPLIEFFDMQWLYRAMWQGAEHLLASLRVAAEVVEGSGSILWSVLILLLVLMVLTNQ
jgi:hypothetical protein